LSEIFIVFRLALRDLLRPKVLFMVLLPIVCAMVLWTLIGWHFWEPLTQWVNGLLLSSSMGQWVGRWSQGAVKFFSVVLTLMMLAPGVLITAMVITEVFTMPGLVNFVAERYYPRLARKHGGTVAGGVLNSVIAIVAFALLWVVTLPLWFTGIGAIVVPLINSAYLNQRVFRHDALTEHADRDELRALTKSNRRKLFGLGLVVAPLLLVPVFNLLVPALSGLAFTHYQLRRLATLRN